MSTSTSGGRGEQSREASTDIALTVLLLIEGWSVLDVRGYLTPHTFIGVVLIRPITLECAARAGSVIASLAARSLINRVVPRLARAG
jgi:hypothetical protein